MGFYDTIADIREDSPELRKCIHETVLDLTTLATTSSRPGILLGYVQGGKTRAFLGVMALAFDQGYGMAIVLTKGTRSLARQTLDRVRDDFKPFIDTDAVQVFDIMKLPGNLTPYELGQKLILVVKKEADNLERLVVAFKETYPSLRAKKVLIIDDEADLASVSFQRRNGEVGLGVIAGQMECLRGLVRSAAFLQVTATPYSLYLQPEDEVERHGTALYRPKRPAFTKILPIHSAYVGGEYYFEASFDPESPAYYMYKPVSVPERDALKKEDGRRLKIENILTEKNVTTLRAGIVCFLMGSAIRRHQQGQSGEPVRKYSFVVHTEQKRDAHAWQERVTAAIHDGLLVDAKSGGGILGSLVKEAYADLKVSVELGGLAMPPYQDCLDLVREALLGGHLMITKVNSDKDVDELLDDRGQLKLRTPMNIFIGGQILDRGVTIDNLVGFYYGRNPQRFQQDTVLQHSRMYGARRKDDLSITRFYAPLHIYQVMQKIHQFDSALREAFVSGAHDRGVYFLQRDAASQLVPCSPNKLMFSKLTAMRPGKRLLPIGFQTVAKTKGKKGLDALDAEVNELCKGKLEGNLLISVDKAVELLQLAYANLEFESSDENECKAHVAALEHLSKLAPTHGDKNKVFLITAAGRDVTRIRESGRPSNAPDTKQQADLAQIQAENIPVLMLLRENGSEERGWRGLPFWWPVIVAPYTAVPLVFAAEAPRVDS